MLLLGQVLLSNIVALFLLKTMLSVYGIISLLGFLCMVNGVFREGNDPEDSSQITYGELLKATCKFANVLKSKGKLKVSHGDCQLS